MYLFRKDSAKYFSCGNCFFYENMGFAESKKKCHRYPSPQDKLDTDFCGEWILDHPPYMTFFEVLSQLGKDDNPAFWEWIGDKYLREG